MGWGYPKVTGVLPIGIENATKLITYVTKSGKEYVCLMRVHCNTSMDTLKSILKELEGEIYQRPPVRSSVKRRLRTRKVNSIDILDYSEKLYLLKISSSPGTYMRKLCHDAGIILGCGAHMIELRRTRSGAFSEKNIVTMQELAEAIYMWRNCRDESELRNILIPMEYALCGMPKVIVDDFAVNSVAYGASINVPGIVAYQEFKKGDTVAIITLKGEAVAIGESVINSATLNNMEKGEVIRPKRVIISKDIYPKAWKK
ncbi:MULTISPECIES: RNA-guided pseudouridylation complex pseudouridine synthase subunit Cbf5 [Acidianus]|uniref:RNA-guided pseudouridylation complex pseudouridine synthase subunit Cbf5 n=1 Tax=Acidianus TaxID=12914 RepID=UPI00064F3771|nr:MULTISPECIES: RNA-guided pseudouridylation complex pseudouridine synthase subunit Cbf5 [Acidianus]NON63555.1 RNA-guided pseudouridylation complex pseudouridine synthase subunit Cbf5 [Acidianus sp. RZ1]